MNVIVAPARSAVGNAGSLIEQYRAMRLELPGEPTARDLAADWLERHGLPSRRVEAWRYTDIRRVWETEFETGGSSPEWAAERLRAVLSACGPEAHAGDLPRLVFVDGVLSQALSRMPERLDVQPFAGVEAAEPLRHPMVALNAMLASDGALIRVPAGQDAGRLLLVSVCAGMGGRTTASHLRHRLVLEVGASLALLEIGAGDGRYLSDSVLDAEIAVGAHLRHVRLQQDSAEAFSFSMVRVAVAERGAYDGFNLALGAALARHEVHATLAGPHAAVHVNGAQLLADAQVADLTSVIAHDAPNCVSRQTVKNVLTGRARGVFQGKIVVARVAQKTDGYQMNQALLLSETAEIDAKPELEIYADDVKCSHGSTAGALDEEQLFYMRSRGVPAAEARAILVRAFLDDALQLVDDEMMRGVLDEAVAAWWRGRAA